MAAHILGKWDCQGAILLILHMQYVEFAMEIELLSQLQLNRKKKKKQIIKQIVSSW